MNGDSDAYYAAVAMRQSAQLRELTARSASEYVAFFEARRYSDEHSTCDPLAKKLLWAETPAFLVKLVGSKPAATDEQPVAEFDPPLEAFEKSAIETFHNFVAAVVGIPTAGSDPATSRRGAPLDASRSAQNSTTPSATRRSRRTRTSSGKRRATRNISTDRLPDRHSRQHAHLGRAREDPLVMEQRRWRRGRSALFDPHVRELLALDVEERVEGVGSKADALEDIRDARDVPRGDTAVRGAGGDDLGDRDGARAVRRVRGRDASAGRARGDRARGGAAAPVRVREKAREVSERREAFEEMQMRATKDSESAEECVDRKKYMKFLPADLEKLKNDIAANEQRFDFLSEHFCGVPDEEFRLYSVALGWPLRMKEILVKASVSAEKEYRKFEAGIKKRRKDFAELVERLRGIEAFAEIGGEKGITDARTSPSGC